MFRYLIKCFSKILIFFSIAKVYAQNDTITRTLNEVSIKAYTDRNPNILRLSDTHETYIASGKKNEVIIISQLNTNHAEKIARQLFAKVPGVFVYDMDGSGNQVNISTRGLDPHRSWELNIRQNGIMTNSDIYGYPASHYSPPMESIQKVELIRGTAALQYGAQFGGMINYITKTPDSTKIISYEGVQTSGSYGLKSSYNAISGTKGKFSYYIYHYFRKSDGYRENATSNAQAQYISLKYDFSESMSMKAELGRSTYIYQIPGALTDSMFNTNPRASTRNRNYFNPDIFVPSLQFRWQISSTSFLSLISSAVIGTRNSVQFIGFANTPDIIQASTNTYKNRQVDIDHFNSYTTELRLEKKYRTGSIHHTLVPSLRIIKNNLHRQQLGKGTSGTDFDLSILEDFGRDMHFRTNNLAFSIENLAQISRKLSISGGLRIENGITNMSGKIRYINPANVPLSIHHQFPLLGISTQYKLNQSTNIYGGFSQAYRPVIFTDIIPTNSLERTNPSIKDAYGNTMEVGFRGRKNSWLSFDISAFLLNYHNRIGSQAINTPTESYILKTNTGNTQTKGLEIFSEITFIHTSQLKLSAFTSTSYFDAKYLKGNVLKNNQNTDIKGNKLESVPQWISRNGINLSYKKIQLSLQHSFVDKSFADALNTNLPTPNGAVGLVPAYTIFDSNCSYKINKNLNLRIAINNLTNTQYFTKRPSGYPGAGIWSSDGRSIAGILSIKL